MTLSPLPTLDIIKEDLTQWISAAQEQAKQLNVLLTELQHHQTFSLVEDELNHIAKINEEVAYANLINNILTGETKIVETDGLQQFLYLTLVGIQKETKLEINWKIKPAVNQT